MTSLQGKIVEFYSGRGVADALVSMGGATALTDANGNFIIQVPPGRWTLQIAHRNFRTYASSMNLSQNMAYTLQTPIKIMSVVRAL